MKKQNQGRKGGKSLLHVTMYEQTTKSLDHEISGCFWDYFGAFKSVNLGIQGTMIFSQVPGTLPELKIKVSQLYPTAQSSNQMKSWLFELTNQFFAKCVFPLKV
jgi:hypothetical protein